MVLRRATVLALLLAGIPVQQGLAQDERRLAAAIESLPPAPGAAGLWRPLRHWMDSTGTPGLSVAVVNDGRIVAVAAYGTTDATNPAAVTPNTIFQAASVSKAVFGLALMCLVQSGAVDLDTPINQILRGWQLPSSPKGNADSVTLRRILNQNDGTADIPSPAVRTWRDDERRAPRLPTTGTARSGRRSATGPSHSGMRDTCERDR